MNGASTRPKPSPVVCKIDRQHEGARCRRPTSRAGGRPIAETSIPPAASQAHRDDPGEPAAEHGADGDERGQAERQEAALRGGGAVEHRRGEERHLDERDDERGSDEHVALFAAANVARR